MAAAVTSMVHGDQELARVQAATKALWGGGDIKELDEASLRAATADLPRASVPLGEASVADALVAVGFERGKSAARRTVASGGVSVNNVRVSDADAPLTESDALPGSLVLLRKGRKNLAVVELV